MKDKNTLIKSTIDGTSIEECPTLGALNAKVWRALRNAGMTNCQSPDKFRLIGNFAGGLSVTQSDGFWKAAEKRNASHRGSSSSGKKAILTNEQYLNKYFALKGMVDAGDPKLRPLIEAIKAELAAHKEAVKAQQERDDKAKKAALIKWFSELPLKQQEQIKASATAVAKEA
jgi:hypothetical protein